MLLPDYRLRERQPPAGSDGGFRFWSNASID